VRGVPLPRLSEEQRMLRTAVEEFVTREVVPIASEIDRVSRFPQATVRRMAEMGLFGVPISKEWGGQGGSYVDYCLVLETLSHACMSHATIVGAHTSLVCLPLERFGTQEQKVRHLRPLASGEKLGAFALTEPGAGSDAAAIKLRAEKTPTGWELTGTKTWITNGAEADLVIVIGVNNPELGSRGGMTAFLVERGLPGYQVGKKLDKMGIRASSTSELYFDRCRVPDQNVLGPVGDGFRVAMSTLDGGRLSLGAGVLGAATAVTEQSIAFVKQRTAFGEPIAHKQAIQLKIADMATGLYIMRELVYGAARRIDQGEALGKESAMIKLFCSETAHQIANHAMQIHGGMGFSTELSIERFYRDQRVSEVFEGTSEILRLLIAEEALKQGL